MAEAGSGRWLVVALGSGSGGRPIALPAARVRALARVPGLTRVPGAPPALAGLAGLSGRALPVLDLARLLDPEAAPPLPTRMVVAEAAGPVGLLVAGIVGLVADPGPAARLDLPALVAACLPRRAAGAAGPAPPGEAAPPPPRDARVALLALTVAGRPYALPLAEVEAVLHRPEAAASPPGPEGLSWRGRPLPLLCLATRLGFGATPACRVAVVRGVGLAAGRVGPVLHLEPGAIDPVPRALRGDPALAGFARPGDGHTLVGILSARALAGDAPEAAPEAAAAPVPARPTDRAVTLDLAGQAYGLPAGAVLSVAPAPGSLVRVPRAPDFLAGMMPVRGGAMPVIDLARRLGLPAGGERRRLVVVEAGGVRAGLLVDGVRFGAGGRTLDPAALLAPAGGLDP
ncbi:MULTISPECIES: chemotaxis protein CheW [Methylobacterium]|jgi:purine-binding chemotaxis protein CheW|uniref:chemotaxis protein CheW n=3 Tax=Methylobacteriaceae TaxID=119045 RepID=UPI0008EB50D1|nr:chemotaxis protein CheW [Methylobacterium sp. yr596]MBZ6411132.1 chemotaxis protein CheW [Methylobacterium sp.]SFE19405.1 purine-binding chemotaxis protein CheW [Methylobacterium sp. yr596]